MTLSIFVYAVAKGAVLSEEYVALRTAAAPIYTRYVRARQGAIRADSSGAVWLWRVWLATRE